MMNDHEAIKLAQAGKQDGFKAIFENHSTYLYTLALRILQNKEQAEDAVQEAFSSAFKHISGFKGTSKLRTWLYTILSRAAFKNLKSSPPDLPYDPELSGKKSSGYDNSEKAHDVRKVLDRLSERDRAILIMAYWDELKVKEIADVLQTNPNHIKILLYRARKKFSEIWQKKNKKGVEENEL